MIIFGGEPLFRHYNQDVNLKLIDRLILKTEGGFDFNLQMFNEDFTLLFRSVDRRGGNLFDIESNDNALLQVLLGNVRALYSEHTIDSTICELVKDIAKSLIWSGRAYYFVKKDIDNGKVYVVPLSSVGVFQLLGKYIQWIPERLERHWNKDDEELPREIRILETTQIMRFDLPKSMKRLLSAQNKILSVIDQYRHAGINFLPHATYENPSPTNFFDFGAWNNIQEHIFYRATQETGWNGRQYDSSKRSDFFDCFRLIRFRRNQLKLRDHILHQVSSELTKIGKIYKPDFFVEISGSDDLLSIAELNELESRLENEEVGFSEIIDYCYKR
ncbi:hypothetical protein [Vibrio diazotrophicus]|uniref:hypothetical protein n=1 Tax=Vibrio diazotrophicus TaxID=685 RepID=UPI0005A842E7|nr:hypothetical protein [Vibrio diazotrophicus]